MFRNELIIYSTSIFSTVRGGFGIGADGELFHFHLDDAAIDCIEHGGFRCDFVCELSTCLVDKKINFCSTHIVPGLRSVMLTPFWLLCLLGHS